MSRRFSAIATTAAHATGHWLAFTAAVAFVLAWGIAGPFFRFSDTWQLVANTATTLVTFILVFLIQATQNRNDDALQAKLDELIRAIDDADNSKIGLEKEGG